MQQSGALAETRTLEMHLLFKTEMQIAALEAERNRRRATRHQLARRAFEIQRQRERQADEEALEELLWTTPLANLVRWNL